MIEKILNLRNFTNIEEINKLQDEVINSNNPHFMFIFLYYINKANLDLISEKILETKNYKYIHLLLSFFKPNNYSKLLNYILLNNNDSSYLFNILYDVDCIENDYRLKIINKIILIDDDYYIIKSLYYYFVVLNLYDEILFNKIKPLIKKKFSININEHNYKIIFDNIIYNENNKKDPDGFSPNYHKGRNNYIPNIIVCHINNTYSSAIYHFYNKEDEVSCHYLIRRDGHIKQILPLCDSAFANGTSINENSDVYYKLSSSNLINSVKDNANYFTFSIEHESFDGSLTNEQLKSTVKVMREIIKYLKNEFNYDFQIDRDHIIGHNEVNPIVRKNCPGDKFPFEKIIQLLKER